MIRIAVLGYGTVGSGVVKVIQTNANIIAKRAGQEVEVKYVLDLRDFPDDPIQSKVVHDFNVILEDPEVDIVVETMGGTKPAYEFVKKSLLAGKSVCTSNKELVAAYGAELVHIAKSKTVNFLFQNITDGTCLIRVRIQISISVFWIDSEFSEKSNDFFCRKLIQYPRDKVRLLRTITGSVLVSVCIITPAISCH